jgi:hypothetical protein
MLKKENDQLEAFKLNEPGSSVDTEWWRKVWKLKVPPKIHIFWWRALQNFLPSKSELKRRHVAKEDHCEACGEPGGNLFHIAFRCTFAIRFWNALKELTGCKIPDLHPSSWTRNLLSGECCTQLEAALVICGIWSTWTGRNNRRHGKKQWSPLVASKHIASMIEEMICLGQEGRTNLPGQTDTWKIPEAGWCKVNTDASFVAAAGYGSGGVVIRNEAGNLLQALSKFYDHLPDALVAELKRWRQEMGYS